MDAYEAGWEPIRTAARDGRMLVLLVDYSDKDAAHPLNDVERFGLTIGHNGFDNHGDDQWQFAGWCMCHDHFVEGKGEPIAWRACDLDETNQAALGAIARAVGFQP